MFFVIGGGMIFAGKLTVGFFIIVMQYFLRLLNSLDNMLEFGDEYRKMLIAKKQLLELCDLPNSLEGNILIRKIDNIAIHNVKVNIEDKILHEKPINFSLQKGNIYQITGKNGSGKTSLLLTLTGVYKGNYTGKILVNGYELRDINILELRKQCVSCMMQNEYLQEITIKEYVTTYLSLTEVESILDIPSFQPIFNGEKFNLKKFYENKLNELSGGERQIIQFFVTITKLDTSLLILDESFSNIAAFIDHYLPDLFEELSRHCIILLVTHRPIEKLACKYIPT